MSDLSRLLDDVYGPTGAAAPPAKPAVPPPGETGLPDWAVESVMDDPFAEWVPGVAPDPSATRATGVDEAVPSTGILDLDAPAEHRAWTRSDDDILPTRRRGWSASRARSSAVAPAADLPLVAERAPADERAPAAELAPTGEVVLTGAQVDEEPAPSRRRFRRHKG